MEKLRSGSVKLLLLWCLWLALGAWLIVTNCLQQPPTAQAQPPEPTRRVMAPYLDGENAFEQSAIFWFGQVNSTSNYADVRVRYNEDEIILFAHVFDRWLWYDETPSIEDLTAWDAVSLYLNLDGNVGTTPSANAQRLVAQLYHSGSRAGYQAAYQGDGAGWVGTSTSFTTQSGWRGDGLNGAEARGWWVKFEIPFASLGLPGPPPEGSTWGLGLTLHDRDDEVGSPIPDQMWPEAMETEQPATWGQLVFGLPSYKRPLARGDDVVTIRHGLNGISVVDGHVGGHSTCPGGPGIWTQWGETNYQGYAQINIQNQWDVADWPCFSKYYVTFPLEAMPPGKVLISATLRLYHFGNAGDGYDPGPQPSYIQVLTVAEDWEETNLTWNNAPLALENVSGDWVDPLDSFPGWPGVAREWDVSYAVAEAYSGGVDRLRLVLYEADSAYHSGKYFYSSDADETGRPMLELVWGEPLEVVGTAYLPLVVKP